MMMQQNPGHSTRRNEAYISTYSRIVRYDLNWFPYRMRRRHEIKEGDYLRRRVFSQWFLGTFAGDQMGSIVIGDEATFCLNGQINIIKYAPRGEMPDIHYDVPASRDKINVWAALCGNGSILGPHFFENNLNGQDYLDLINDEIVPQMMETIVVVSRWYSPSQAKRCKCNLVVKSLL